MERQMQEQPQAPNTHFESNFASRHECADVPVDGALVHCEGESQASPRDRSGRGGPLLVHVPPPLVYVAVFLLGVGLQRVVPLVLPLGVHAPAVRAAGGAALALGILLGPMNALMFLARGATLNPTRTPKRLFTGGVYRITRNPMYLGLLLVYAGLAFMHAQIWALILIAVPFAAADRIYIPCEEQRMTEAFGADYLQYCRRVRRWIGLRQVRRG